MSAKKIKTNEGQVISVTKRIAKSGNWAHGLVIKGETYTLFTEVEFFPVRIGDYVSFSFQTKRLQSGRRRAYNAIQPDSLHIQAADCEDDMAGGYVYVLENEAMPDIVKIGFTKRTPTERAKELSAHSGVRKPFNVAFSIKVQGNAELVERACHEELKMKRRGKEFFYVSAAKAEKIIIRKYKEIYPENFSRQDSAIKKRMGEFDVNRKEVLAKMHKERERKEYESSPEYKWKTNGSVIAVKTEFTRLPKGVKLHSDLSLVWTDYRSTFNRLFGQSPKTDWWLNINILGRRGYEQRGEPPWRVLVEYFRDGQHISTSGDRFKFVDAEEIARKMFIDSGISNYRCAVKIDCELLDEPGLLVHEVLPEKYGNYYFLRRDFESIRIKEGA